VFQVTGIKHLIRIIILILILKLEMFQVTGIKHFKKCPVGGVVAFQTPVAAAEVAQHGHWFQRLETLRVSEF
jgi:hypothetical protein